MAPRSASVITYSSDLQPLVRISCLVRGLAAMVFVLTVTCRKLDSRGNICCCASRSELLSFLDYVDEGKPRQTNPRVTTTNPVSSSARPALAYLWIRFLADML